MLTVSISDVQAVRPIASNLGTGAGVDRFSMYVSEARRLDIQPVITAELLNKIDNDSTSPLTYGELVNGGTYTYLGDTYSFEGLKVALAYFVYARLIRANPVMVTAFGVVNKVDQNSERSTDAMVNRMANNAQAIADAYLQDCVLYIQQNLSDESPNEADSETQFGISVIGD